jgi:tetratricopeptide (TPR) repeat protein
LTLDSTLPEHRAFALTQLGSVALGSGDVEGAERSYRNALRARPGYVHAQAGLARVDLARGRPAMAVRRLRVAVGLVPYPAYVTLLAETLQSFGRSAEARKSFALVRSIHALQRANGVRTDLQAALFEADRGDRPRAALAMARLAHAVRPSIQAADTLAWALYRNGRCAEAQRYAAQAHRLRTKDALTFFHRGMIERCLGNEEAGRAWLRRALDLNPGFSPMWSPVAARYAR